jgi:hypothetical protein
VTQEGVGAVDRVDRPNPAALEPFVIVLRLLRQPAIVGARHVKREFQRDVEREVGLAHLAAVDLPFDVTGLRNRALARFARAFLKKRVIFFEGGRFAAALRLDVVIGVCVL